jgi:FixJ family two-component response regulator
LSNSHIVYVIDPDAAIGEALSLLLETYGIAVRTFTNAESFLGAQKNSASTEGCLLVEADLPGLSSLSLAREVSKQDPSPPIIILTDSANPEFRLQALSVGVTEVLEKPLMSGFLLERLSALMPGATDLPDPSLSKIRLATGTHVTFRVMRPEDADIEQAFVRGLSVRSKHMRFFSVINELLPEMLERFTHHEYPISYALIATVMDDEQERQIGVARYLPTESEGVAEFAVVVADEWQGHGIATQLLQGLTTAAAVAGVNRLEGMVLRENDAMLKLARGMGFKTSRCVEDFTVLHVEKTLNANVDPLNSDL